MTERHKPPSLVLSLAERSSLMRYSVLFATITNPFTKQLMKLMKKTEMRSKKMFKLLLLTLSNHLWLKLMLKLVI